MNSASRLLRAGVLLVTFASLAFVAAKDAAIAAFSSSAPQHLLAMGIKDGKTLSKIYTAKLADGRLAQPLALQERRDLIVSLSDAPLDRRVLRTLALDSEARNQGELARRLMRLASRVSRRDVTAQLWLVNDAVARKDVEGVLDHYDAALSIRNDTYQILLPAMTRALVYPQFRAELIPLLKAERPWVESFVSHAVSYAPTVVPMAELIREAGSLPNERQLRPMLSQLLNRLVDEGRVHEAREFAVDVLGADPEVLKQAGITEATVDADYAPLTWRLIEGADLAAYLGDGGQIEIRVTSDGWRPAISRVFEGRPGRYEIAFSSLSPPGAAAASFRVTANCVKLGEKNLIFQRNFEAVTNASTWRERFNLPTDCVGIAIDFLARSERLGSDAVTVIRDFEIVRTSD